MSKGNREPVLLTVLMQPGSLCWHAAGIRRDGRSVPLLRSEENSMTDYRGLEPEAQRSWLRHCIAGVLQRGCDRLFARNMRAEHFVLIADRHFPDAAEGLTEQLADHFVQWVINPPVTCLLTPPGFVDESPVQWQLVAGELPEAIDRALHRGLPELVSELEAPAAWELIAKSQQSS